MSSKKRPPKRQKSRLEKGIDVVLVLAFCFAVISVWKPWKEPEAEVSPAVQEEIDRQTPAAGQVSGLEGGEVEDGTVGRGGGE